MKKYALLAVAALALNAACGDDVDDTKGASCASICPAVIEPGCQNGPADLEECLEGCNIQRLACPTEMDALLACTAGKTFSCDDFDSPTASGCDSETEAVYNCLEEPSVDCEAICPAVMAAGCSNGPPDLTECVAGCSDAQLNCPDEMTAVLLCAEGNDFSCDANDAPVAEGCATFHAALDACIGE